MIEGADTLASRRTVTTYCRICPALCGIEVELHDDRIVAVRGDRKHQVSAGYTCPKGRALPEEHEDPERVRSSLRREADGSYLPVPSDRAITEIGERLSRIVAEHGPRSVGLYVGTRGYEVLPLAAGTAWLQGIGSPSLYSTYTIDQPGKDLARAAHGSWPAGFHDASTSDVLLLVGLNPVVSGFAPYVAFPVANPRVELAAARRRGQRLIVIDPRRHRDRRVRRPPPPARTGARLGTPRRHHPRRCSTRSSTTTPSCSGGPAGSTRSEPPSTRSPRSWVADLAGVSAELIVDGGPAVRRRSPRLRHRRDRHEHGAPTRSWPSTCCCASPRSAAATGAPAR